MNPSMYGSFGSVPMGGYVPFNPPAPDMSNATNMQQQFQMWLQQKVSMGQVAPQHLAAFSSAPLLWDPFQFHLLPMATEPRFAESIPNPIAPTPITFPSSSSSSFSNAAAMPMYDSRGNFPRAPSPTGNDDDEEDGDDILHNYVPSSQKKKFSTSVPSNNDVPANVSSQSIIREGWIMKRQDSGRMKQRYLILRSESLHVLKRKPTSARETVASQKGYWKLGQVDVGKTLFGADEYVCVRDLNEMTRALVFQAQSTAEVDSWVADIQNSSDEIKGIEKNEMEHRAQRRLSGNVSDQQQIQNSGLNISLKVESGAFNAIKDAVSSTRQSIKNMYKGTPSMSSSAVAAYITPTSPPRNVFHVPLSEIAFADPVYDIPNIVLICLDFLAPHVQVEGIFRLSGSAAVIDSLKERFDSEPNVVLPSNTDPHAVAGVLKLFLRVMPEPLLTYDLYEAFSRSTMCATEQEQKMMLQNTIMELPQRNLCTLRALIQFLAIVAQYSEFNKMSPQNLAIVFSPNIMIRKGATPIEAMVESKASNEVVMNMIYWVTELFP